MDEAAGFVGEIDGEAVDLGFGDERERGIGGQAEEAAGTLVPFVECGGVEGVVEGEHGRGVT